MITNNVNKARINQDTAKLKSIAKQGGAAGNDEAIVKAAEDFESVFLAQMLESMFADVDLAPGSEGPGEDIYKSLMLNEYGKLMARSGGIGVADHVKAEMIRMQEVEQPALLSAPQTNSSTSPAHAEMEGAE